MGLMGSVGQLVEQSIASGAVDERVEQIFDYVTAIQQHQAVGGTLTADGTEQQLYVDNEPLGCARAMTLYVNCSNMQAGDTIELRNHARLVDGGNIEQFDYAVLTGLNGGLLNGNLLYAWHLEPFRHGFGLTLHQIDGTNRDYEWELHVKY